MAVITRRVLPKADPWLAAGDLYTYTIETTTTPDVVEQVAGGLASAWTGIVTGRPPPPPQRPTVTRAQHRLPVGIGLSIDPKCIPTSAYNTARLPRLKLGRDPWTDAEWNNYTKEGKQVDRPKSDNFRRDSDGCSHPLATDDQKQRWFRACLIHDIMYISPMPEGLAERFGEDPHSASVDANGGWHPNHLQIAQIKKSLAHYTWKTCADRVMMHNCAAISKNLCDKASPELGAHFFDVRNWKTGLATFGGLLDGGGYTGGQHSLDNDFRLGSPMRAPLTLSEYDTLIEYLDAHELPVVGTDWDPGPGIFNSPERWLRTDSADATPALATRVQFGPSASEVVGELRKLSGGSTRWLESHTGDTRSFSFDEQSRDERTIRMRDENRAGVELLVDLDAGVIRYRDQNNAWFDLYQVVSVV